jgi:hypothetical protein
MESARGRRNKAVITYRFDGFDALAYLACQLYSNKDIHVVRHGQAEAVTQQNRTAQRNLQKGPARTIASMPLASVASDRSAIRPSAAAASSVLRRISTAHRKHLSTRAHANKRLCRTPLLAELPCGRRACGGERGVVCGAQGEQQVVRGELQRRLQRAHGPLQHAAHTASLVRRRGMRAWGREI